MLTLSSALQHIAENFLLPSGLVLAVDVVIGLISILPIIWGLLLYLVSLRLL